MITIAKLTCRAASAANMRVALRLLVLVSAALLLSCSQPQAEKTIAPSPTPQTASLIGPPGFPPAVLGKPYPGTGIVKEINRKEGWVTLDHEEVKDLMPPMIMEFWIRDPSLMNRIRVGDKVDFVVVEDSKGQYLSEMKKAASR